MGFQSLIHSLQPKTKHYGKYDTSTRKMAQGSFVRAYPFKKITPKGYLLHPPSGTTLWALAGTGDLSVRALVLVDGIGVFWGSGVWEDGLSRVFVFVYMVPKGGGVWFRRRCNLNVAGVWTSTISRQWNMSLWLTLLFRLNSFFVLYFSREWPFILPVYIKLVSCLEVIIYLR